MNSFALTPNNISISLCYLSGPMENVSREEADTWRQRAMARLKSFDIHSLLPGTPGVVESKDRCPYEAFTKDMQLMSIAKYLLVNLEDMSIARHGTAMEIMHFGFHLKRPVVGFSNEIDRCKRHPFFASLVRLVPSMEEACDYIGKLEKEEK